LTCGRMFPRPPRLHCLLASAVGGCSARAHHPRPSRLQCVEARVGSVLGRGRPMALGLTQAAPATTSFTQVRRAMCSEAHSRRMTLPLNPHHHPLRTNHPAAFREEQGRCVVAKPSQPLAVVEPVSNSAQHNQRSRLRPTGNIVYITTRSRRPTHPPPSTSLSSHASCRATSAANSI
jgi:hypothetical protein